MAASSDTTIELSHKGDVSPRSLDDAVEKVRNVTRLCREPVRHIEIRLTFEPNPARERPAIAEATVDVDGYPVRAHVAASTVEESVDIMVDRLRRRIDRHEDRRHRIAERHRTGDSGPGEWRHGDLTSSRPEELDIPFDEREVRRHKTFALEPMSVEEALFDLEQLGHDFYLFVDQSGHVDAMVRRAELEIELLRADGADGSAGINGVRVLKAAAPRLSLTDAKEHLEAAGEPHLFFVSTETGRGQVLYRRFDGHYGLVTST